MLTFAVMPCLNEAELVGDAVASLLSPVAHGATETVVVVVDNGSSDGTMDILSDLAVRHPGRVRVLTETERGYVPPRRRGVTAVAGIADEMGIPYRDILVMQADADTVYRPGYVDAMRGAAIGAEGSILEGSIRRPAAFEAAHPGYVAAERAVDADIEPLEAADEDDVVVDDKVCAYRLSNYLEWGGLFEEFSAAGDPIHAETTRMFIRARLRSGVAKVRVNPAGAFPSRRRVLEDPRYHFSTLGFPRERSWARPWTEDAAPQDVDTFARAVIDGAERDAVRLRRSHLLALFRYLPAIVLDAAGSNTALLNQPDVFKALALLPNRGRDLLAERPSLAILDVLGLIDNHPELFS